MARQLLKVVGGWEAYIPQSGFRQLRQISLARWDSTREYSGDGSY